MRFISQLAESISRRATQPTGASSSVARSNCPRGGPYLPGSEANSSSNTASSKYAVMRSMSSPCRSLCHAMNDRIRPRTWSNCAAVFGTWTVTGTMFSWQVLGNTQTSNEKRAEYSVVNYAKILCNPFALQATVRQKGKHCFLISLSRLIAGKSQIA